jgi:hypothetical protein
VFLHSVAKRVSAEPQELCCPDLISASELQALPDQAQLELFKVDAVLR